MATSTRRSRTPATPKKTKRATSKTAASGLNKHSEPSPQLAAIIGNKPMPRTQVTKKVWDYIKSHKLQDSQNRRMIKADDKLKQVLGGKKQVSMFELTKFVSKNLKEKQD